MDRFRFILSYARRERRALAATIGLTSAGACIGALQPWPLKALFDHVLGEVPVSSFLSALLTAVSLGQSREQLALFAACAALGVYLLQALVTGANTWIWAQAARRMTLGLAQEIFRRLQARSLQFHRSNMVGDLTMCVLRDSRCVADLLEKAFVTPLLAALTASVMIVIMLKFNRDLALIAALAPPIVFLGSLTFGRSLQAAARLRRELEGSLQSLVHQALSGVFAVQAFSQEGRMKARFSELAESQVATARRTALLTGLNKLGSGLLATAARCAVIWLGARQVLEGRLTIGGAAVFFLYFESLLGASRTIAEVYPAIQTQMASLSRVMNILKAPPEIEDAAPGAPFLAAGGVRFENVSVGYEKGHPILRNVNLDVRPAEVIALLGPSGGGKSTLASLIARFCDPWEGSVKIDSRDVRSIPLEELRRQIGFVFQDACLSPVSIAENIAGAVAQSRRLDVERAARAAMAHDFIVALPKGYDTIVGSRGVTLSSGMRQRIAIARALFLDARILILDEPTSSLDAETEQDLLRALKPIMKGRTTFILAHRQSTIAHADRILKLSDGCLREILRPERN